MSQHPLEGWLKEHLEVPIIVVRADATIGPSGLNRAEREQFRSMKSGQRRREWLLGRAALKKLLTALGRSADTAAVTFPDRRVSLTHGGATAFAAGTPAASRGIGVDYEPLRTINEQVARWFLNEAETAWLDEQASRRRTLELLRLWTVKEAAFKSHPDNGRLTLRAFSIDNPADAVSSVAVARSGACIRIASCAFDQGFFSIAVNVESE